MRYKVKNWLRFQHFKDRRPPWIKLHREILDQRDIMLLSSDAFRFLVCLWLLASEDRDMQGNLPSVDDIAYRLRLDAARARDLLRQVDIFLISTRHQDGPPETETETETETEEVNITAQKPKAVFEPMDSDVKEGLLFQVSKEHNVQNDLDARTAVAGHLLGFLPNEGEIVAQAAAAAKKKAIPKERLEAAERIYASYPRKVGHQKAIEAICKQLKDGREERDLIEATEAYAASARARILMVERAEMIPHPATWFNQGRFLDDRGEWERIPKLEPGAFPSELRKTIEYERNAERMENGGGF